MVFKILQILLLQAILLEFLLATLFTQILIAQNRDFFYLIFNKVISFLYVFYFFLNIFY